MNSYTLFSILLLLPFFLCAQSGGSPCDAYDRLIREAKEKLADVDNLDADFVYKKLRAARLKSSDCAASDPTRVFFPEVDNTLSALFEILESQRDEAKAAREDVQSRNEQLDIQSKQLQAEKQRSDSLRQLAELQNTQLARQTVQLESTIEELKAYQGTAIAEKERAEAVLNKIYFYNGEYGLATNGDSKKPKYGYINKELETLIPFEYEQALPFDNSGFAKVRKKENAFLLDITGKEYRLAENLDQLTMSITALDLRRLLDRRKRGNRRRGRNNGRNNLAITSRMPALVNNFQNLVIVLANRGQLQDIDNLGKLRKLKELQLSENEIENIQELGSLSRLEHLRLDRNKIQEIGSLTALKKLKTLNLHSNDIKVVNDFNGLEALEWLNLGNNKIKSYSSPLDLPNLRYLNLSDNKMININGVSALGKLKELSVEQNILRNLDSIARLTNLERLNISNNKISALDPISNMTALRVLNIARNSLKDLTPIAQLENLEVLDISDNCGIRSIAPLFRLSKLKRLTISNCKSISMAELNELQRRLPDCKIMVK